MGRMYKFKYLDAKKGGVIMEAECYKSIARMSDLPFVSLELMDKDDGRYRVWVGNEKIIHKTLFFPQTIEGFQEAKREFMNHYDSSIMNKHTDWSKQEEMRLEFMQGIYKAKEKVQKPDTSLLKNEMQLRKVLSRMIKKNQIDQDKLINIFSEEKQSI
jgi:hypothetical protein